MGLINTKLTAEDVKSDDMVHYAESKREESREHSDKPSDKHSDKPSDKHSDKHSDKPRDKQYDEWKLERDHHLWEFGSVYKIVNDQDDLVYIGSTVGTIEKRFNRHKKDARNDSTCALHFHMRALGFEHFSIHLIDTVRWATVDELQVVESKYITSYKSVIVGLNLQYASRMCHHECVLKCCKDCNISIACEHHSNRRWCHICKHTGNALDMCYHNKMRGYCHYCNRCKCCDAISTAQHILTADHIQNKIRADALDARRKFIREQNTLQDETLKRIGFTYVQLRILDKRRIIRRGVVKYRKLNRKRVNLIRSAWDVYSESLNQADN
jgi:hypothetical protein